MKVAETRATPLPQVMSLKSLRHKELATISGSSLQDILQLYDVQREFGEQDQQAPIVDEVKESGVSQFIQTNSMNSSGEFQDIKSN